jgi:hypothetical protein
MFDPFRHVCNVFMTTLLQWEVTSYASNYDLLTRNFLGTFHRA